MRIVMFPRFWFAALAAGLLAPSVRADMPDEYRSLLAAADRIQGDAQFVGTAELVAEVVPGGMDEVLTALSEIAPRRIALFDAPPAPGREPVMVVEASPVDVGPVPADGAVTSPAADAAHGREGWARTVGWIAPDLWDGRVRFGIRLDRGNTELSDYNFAVELDREFDHGWSLDSKVEYFYTEGGDGVTRDNWLVQARGERATVDGWGYYVGGSFERDRLSGIDSSTFATAGGSYQGIDSARMSWIMRAGTGARYRVPDNGEAADTDWVAELGSVYDLAISDTSEFKSETTLLASNASRADQRFALNTAIGGDWGVEVGVRIKHEFEPEPGNEPTDTRFDVSIVRDF